VRAVSKPGDRQGQRPLERSVVLATKLHVPAAPSSELVHRAGLLDTLAAIQHHKLTLLSAPAGWGKTTALAQWISQVPGETGIGWLTIDSSDNDPVRFWLYVIAALQKAIPGVGAGAVDLLAIGADPIGVVLPILLNELDTVTTAAVLVFDDYHSLTTRAVHDQLAFVVGRMPANLHLVIATRSDPILPLARLRAEGDLVEVRAGELGFDIPEARQLLRDVVGHEVVLADVASLCHHTEGWAAGLYLAGLCLRGHDDVSTFVKTFAGDNRHIFDYLMAEVIDFQPVEVRRFLLRTSLLGRLSAALCDAVLEHTDSASILEEIERDNLFVVPLDMSRQWYRYHHLFAELLRAELHRSEPQLIAELHRRAAAWFRAQNLVDEALPHLAASGDTAAVSDLIAADWENEFNAGRLSTVMGWLDLLPHEAIVEDPRLCVARAWIASTSDHFDEAARWIDAVEASSPPNSTRSAHFAGQIAALRAFQLFKTGEITDALEAVSTALGLELDGAPLARSTAYVTYGCALYFEGRHSEAYNAFQQAVRVAEQLGVPRARAIGLGYSAMILAERGDTAGAEAAVRKASGSHRDLSEPEHCVDPMGTLATAKILDLRGHIDEAAKSAAAALVMARQCGVIPEIEKALATIAEFSVRLGDHHGADAGLRERAALMSATAGRRGIPAPTSATPSGSGDPDLMARAPLTPRELEVLRLLATRLSRREIGERLVVSLNTIKTHQRAVYRKLGVQGRKAATRRARELGLL
jgi:LuxR family transcriptional regulator, maltose regulon positive regulatory protein